MPRAGNQKIGILRQAVREAGAQDSPENKELAPPQTAIPNRSPTDLAVTNHEFPDWDAPPSEGLVFQHVILAPLMKTQTESPLHFTCDRPDLTLVRLAKTLRRDARRDRKPQLGQPEVCSRSEDKCHVEPLGRQLSNARPDSGLQVLPRRWMRPEP